MSRPTCCLFQRIRGRITTINIDLYTTLNGLLVLILRGFFFSRSASNLYATDVFYLLREMNSLFTETMQNATLILTGGQSKEFSFSGNFNSVRGLPASTRHPAPHDSLIEPSSDGTGTIFFRQPHFFFLETLCPSSCFPLPSSAHKSNRVSLPASS